MQSKTSASTGVDAAGRSRPLNEATRSLIEQSLTVRSAPDTMRLFRLTPSAVHVSLHQVESIRRGMAKRGARLFSARKSAALRPIGEHEDRARRCAAEDGSRSLLIAQLLAGQHYHTFENAQRIADAIGAPSALVRPGIGDTLNHGA